MLRLMNAIAQASAAPLTGPKLDNRRVLAGIVDLVIVAVGAAVVLVAGDALSGDRGDVRGALGVVILGWALYYFFALESGDGQTVGKKLTKLRVVRADGRPAGMREIAVRTVLRVVDNYLVGLIVMLATGNRRQRLGDLAAGTIVVDASGPSAPVAVAEPVEEVQVIDDLDDLDEPDQPVAEEPEPVQEPVHEADEPVMTRTITLPARPEPPATLADIAEPVVTDEPVVAVEEPAVTDEDMISEFTSPSLEELAQDVAAAHVAVEVEPEPEPELDELPDPGVDELAEPGLDEPADDDGPVTVKSVETVSAIDLVMGGASEDDSSESTSESAMDAEDPAAS
jgi:uncharacterized RDD family membrane protein YckC